MKYFSKIAFVIILSLTIFSCSQDEQIDDSTTNKSLESVLSEMSKIAKSENKIVKFTLLINKETNTYGYKNIKLLDYSQQVLDFNKGVQNATSNSLQRGGGYQVDCTDSEGNTTSTICADYICVGYQTVVCVENGGCATVCEVEVTIAP